MNNPSNDPGRLQELNDAFASELRRGKRPRIEDYLTLVNAELREPLLDQLLLVELQHRHTTGERIGREDYESRFEDHRHLVQQVLQQFTELSSNARDAGATVEHANSSLATGCQASDPEIPEQIGDYKIIQPIGKGGMGQVFLAEQRQPVKRRVALKVIKTDTPTKEILARFEAEQQALAMMNHENIAKVLDAGRTSSGRPYFVMELVKGVPLNEYCDANRLPPQSRLELFVQTCRAVQHAHQKGIAHRDLKPGNILVTDHDGKPMVKVIDFGLAKALEDAAQLTDRSLFTRYGQVVGTLAYMSPEQAEMNVLDVDARTDVYSLGVILYELLTGSTPISPDRIRDAAFDRILAMIREEEAIRPSARLREMGDQASAVSEDRQTDARRLTSILKGDLDWIVGKALEKDRSRRYDSPAALADDVQRFLTDDVVEARPPSLRYRLRKAIRKHTGVFAAGALIFALFAAGLLGTGTMWVKATRLSESNAALATENEQRATRAEAAERLAGEEKAKAEAERDTANRARALAEATSARSSYFSAMSHWDADRIAEANAFLDQVPSKYRQLEWHFAKQDFQKTLTCYVGGLGVRSVAFSPDGSRVLSTAPLKVWDAVTGDETIACGDASDGVSNAAFSADGRRIAAGRRDGKIQIWDSQTGALIRTLNAHRGSILSLNGSADGEFIVSGGADAVVKVWSWATGKEILAIEDDQEHPAHGVAVSPDGSQAASTDGNTIKLWDLSTGELQHAFSSLKADATCLAFSPDGVRIVAGNEIGSVMVLGAHTKKVHNAKVLHDGAVHAVAFSPDGQWIVSAGGSTSINISTSSHLRISQTLKGHQDQVRSLQFSPDGSRVVSGGEDAQVKIWSVFGAQQPRHSRHVLAVKFLPHSDRFVSASSDETLKIWDASTGVAIHTLIGHQGLVASVDVNASGERIVSGSQDGKLKLWDSATGAELKTFSGHSSTVNCVAFAPDSKRIASGGADKTIRIWDATTGNELRAIKAHTKAVRAVAVSPDGRLLVSGGGPTVKAWDLSSGRAVAAFPMVGGAVFSIQFSPSGDLVAVGRIDGSVQLWDIKTRQLVHNFSTRGFAYDVCFSEDGTRLVSCSLDGVQLWDVGTGEELRTWRCAGAKCVCIAPDGETIACGAEYGPLHVWRSKMAEARFLRHPSRAIVHGFSPDGSKLYTSAFRSRLIWDTATGDAIHEEPWDVDKIRGPTSPSGRWQATAHGNHVILVDMEFKHIVRERVARKLKASPKVDWHKGQAAHHAAGRRWYASVIHSAWWLSYNQSSQPAYDSLHEAYGNLHPAIKAHMPDIVSRALALPNPDGAN